MSSPESLSQDNSTTPYLDHSDRRNTNNTTGDMSDGSHEKADTDGVNPAAGTFATLNFVFLAELV